MTKNISAEHEQKQARLNLLVKEFILEMRENRWFISIKCFIRHSGASPAANNFVECSPFRLRSWKRFRDGMKNDDEIVNIAEVTHKFYCDEQWAQS